MSRQIIKDKQDLTFLSWTKIRNSSGTVGSFFKAYTEIGNKKTYYKLSNYDVRNGITGHECVNEIIAARLLEILDIPHLNYNLIYADIVIDGNKHTTYVCSSEDFKKPGDSKIALDIYYQMERLDNETPLEFCIRQGWEDYIYKMLLVDFLILNRDRHGANIEVLRNSRSKTIRLADLFDHGLSLIFSAATTADICGADVMEDKPVQCFVGSKSARDNLNIIPPNYNLNIKELKEQDREYIFEGIDGIMPQQWQDKVWEMIWKRWRYYESVCNKR